MEPHAFESLGAKEFKRAETDWHVGMLPAPTGVPDTYTPAEFYQLKALMQGKEPACGGFSLAQTLQYLLFLQTGNPIALSPRFAYMAEKTLDGVPHEDGTTIQAIGAGAKNLGVCLDALVMDDITLPTSQYQDIFQASPEAKQDALTRSGWNYFLLNDLSFNGIKRAIYDNKAIILQLTIGSEWWTDLNGNVSWAAKDVLPVRPPKSPVSDHFVVLGSYDSLIHFINHWSQAWGNNGFGSFGENYLPFVRAGLAIKKVPPEIKQTLPPPIPPAEKTILQQILVKLAQVLILMKRQLGQTVLKVGTSTVPNMNTKQLSVEAKLFLHGIVNLGGNTAIIALLTQLLPLNAVAVIFMIFNLAQVLYAFFDPTFAVHLIQTGQLSVPPAPQKTQQ